MKLTESYKVKVTPEQSREIQELVFKNGGRWVNGSTTLIRSTYSYLVLDVIDNRIALSQLCVGDKNLCDNTEITAPELIALLSQKETKMPELSSFLKCEKVRCVNNTGQGGLISVGKIYNAQGFCLEVRITDEQGDDFFYNSDHFEPVLETAIQATEKPASEPLATENSKPEFKAGQKAYVPWMNDGKIVTLEVDCNGDLCANTLKGKQDFDKYGVSFGSPTQPDLFHATQENYETLSKLMPWIDFEKPPVVLQGDELCITLLNSGKKRVYVKDEHGSEWIIHFHNKDEEGVWFGEFQDGKVIRNVTPIDFETGEILTSEVLDEQ